MGNWWDNSGSSAWGQGDQTPAPQPQPQSNWWDNSGGSSWQQPAYQPPAQPSYTNPWDSIGQIGQSMTDITDAFSQQAPSYQNQSQNQNPYQYQADYWGNSSAAQGQGQGQGQYTPDINDVFGAAGQALTAGADYNQQARDYQDYATRQQQRDNPFAGVFDVAGQALQAGANAAQQPDPNALNFNPENPSESYADYYHNHDPRGIVEAYQQEASKPTLPQDTGSGGGTWGSSNDWNNTGAAQQNPGYVVDTAGVQANRPKLPYQEGYTFDPGGAGNVPLDNTPTAYTPEQQTAMSKAVSDLKGTGSDIGQSLAAPWQQPTKQGMNPFEFIGDTANKIVGSALGAVSTAAPVVGEVVNDVAQGNVPVVSQLAGLGQGVYSNWTEPILSTTASAVGDVLKPADYAFRSLFDRQGVADELTQAKIAREQAIYNQAKAEGKSEAEAQALAKAEDVKTGYNDNVPYPMQVPTVLSNAARTIFDRDNLTKESTQKKIDYLQEYFNSQIAGGATPEEAGQATQELDKKLGNFAVLSEYGGLQKFATLPAATQAAVMFFDPIGNKVGAEVARPVLGAAGKLASGAKEATGLDKLGEKFIESPQQKAYNFENSVNRLTPALGRYSEEVGTSMAKAVQQFVDDADFRAQLGYTESPKTAAITTALQNELDNVSSRVTPAAAPSDTELIAANKQAYTQKKLETNIASGVFANEADALADADRAAQFQFNTINKPADLTRLQSALPWLEPAAKDILDAQNQAYHAGQVDSLVKPDTLTQPVIDELRLGVKADVVDPKTGEVKAARPLAQLGKVGGAIARGPGPLLNPILTRLWLNSPGRLARDAFGNFFKGGVEDMTILPNKGRAQLVDEIGLQKPPFENTLSNDAANMPGSKPNTVSTSKVKRVLSVAGNAAALYLNKTGEATGYFMRALSHIGDNPLQFGKNINETVGNWEAGLKETAWNGEALQQYFAEVRARSEQLAQKYNVPKEDLAQIIGKSKITTKELRDFADTNAPAGQAEQFAKEVAAARQDARIGASEYATKRIDDTFFNYKKDNIEAALSGWFPFSYWTEKNMGWMARYLAKNPAKIGAIGTFLDQNQEKNRKEGVPDYLRNYVLVGKKADGSLIMYNWTSTLPLAIAGGDNSMDAFITVAAGDKDGSTARPATKKDLGAMLLGSDTPGGGRDKGILPSIYGVSPVIDIMSKEGWINDALRSLKVVDDGFGAPGPRNKQTLGLSSGRSVEMSIAAALNWPLDLLRSLNIGITDLDSEGPQNELLFGKNAGKNLTKITENLAIMVKDGKITEQQGRQALAGIKAGKWNDAALDALDKTDGANLGEKLLSMAGIPVAVANTPADQLNDSIRQGWAAVKDDKGQYVDKEYTDPITGKKTTRKEFQPGKAQQFLTDHPEAKVLWSGNDTAEEINKGLQDDVTSDAVTALNNRLYTEKSISRRDFDKEMDALKEANPTYFQGEVIRDLMKGAGLMPLKPGEEMPDLKKLLANADPQQAAQQRQFLETSDDYYNLTPGFQDLQDRAYALKDKGDEKGYRAIVDTDKYRNALKKQNDFIQQNPDWFDQYSQAVENKYGSAPKTLADRRYQEKLGDYYNIGGDAFDELSAKYQSLLDAGKNSEAYKILGSKEYQAAKAQQLDFIKANPDFREKYDADQKAKGNKGLPTDEEITYKGMQDQYYAIGGTRYQQLQDQAQAAFAKGDTKKGYAITDSKEFKNYQLQQSKFLDDNANFGEKFRDNYLAKNWKPIKGTKDLTFDQQQAEYSNIGGDTYDYLSSLAQKYYDAGNSKAGGLITQKPEYKQAQADRFKFLQDHPDFREEYFAKYPSAEASYNKKVTGGTGTGTGSTGSSGYTSSYSSSGSSSKKPYVPYTAAQKKAYAISQSGGSSYSTSSSSSSGTSAAPWTSAQKKVYAQDLAAGKSKADATAHATALGSSSGSSSGATSQQKQSGSIVDVFSRSNSTSTKKTYPNTYGSTTRTTGYQGQNSGYSTGPSTSSGGYDGYLKSQNWDVFQQGGGAGNYGTNASAARAAASQANQNYTDHTFIPIKVKSTWYVYGKEKASLTSADAKIQSDANKYSSTISTGSSSSSSGYIPKFYPGGYDPNYTPPLHSYPVMPRKQASAYTPIHNFLPSVNQPLHKGTGRKRFK